jgi:hypothetical protein
MNKIIEKKLRLSNCSKLQKNKKLKTNEKVLLKNKNKNKTVDVILNNLYSFILKSDDAICSSESHLREAVYQYVANLSPNDHLFNQDDLFCDMKKSVVTEAVTERYLLGLDIAPHLQQYINVDYLK